MMEKIMKVIDIEENIDFEDTIGNIKLMIEAFEIKYSNFDVLYIDKEYGYTCDIPIFNLMGNRLETDEEFNERKHTELAQKELEKILKIDEESQDWVEYQRLKEKFEGV